MDNYYKNCPPKSYSKGLTNYRSPSSTNEYIKYMNGITRNDDYRLFLQTNAVKLMDTEWMYLLNNNSCWNNACVHKYPTRMDPRDFASERENSDLLFMTRQLPDNLKCTPYADYRMSDTPLQNYQIPGGLCSKCNTK